MRRDKMLLLLLSWWSPPCEPNQDHSSVHSIAPDARATAHLTSLEAQCPSQSIVYAVLAPLPSTLRLPHDFSALFDRPLKLPLMLSPTFFLLPPSLEAFERISSPRTDERGGNLASRQKSDRWYLLW